MKLVPVSPPRTRNAVNMLISLAAAVPTEHPHSIRIARLYEFLLPMRWLNGPQISDEKPMARSTPALVTFSVSGVVVNSAAISGVAGSREVLEKVTARVIQLRVKRMMFLRQRGRA